MSCRFFDDQPTKNLLLAIPGGPVLSGTYLDSFVDDFCKKEPLLNLAGAVLDLPNHGNSQITPELLPLSYQNCVDFIEECLNEVLLTQKRKTILIGHSLGARLLLDILFKSSYISEQISAAILMSCPNKFESSTRFKNETAQFTSPPRSLEDFIEYWNTILPLYFSNPAPDKIRRMLTSNLSWEGNSAISAEAPPVPIKSNHTLPPMMFIEGSRDIRLPDNNFETLQKLFPNSFFSKTPNCSHFPMFENAGFTQNLIQNFLIDLQF